MHQRSGLMAVVEYRSEPADGRTSTAHNKVFPSVITLHNGSRIYAFTQHSESDAQNSEQERSPDTWAMTWPAA